MQAREQRVLCAKVNPFTVEPVPERFTCCTGTTNIIPRVRHRASLAWRTVSDLRVASGARPASVICEFCARQSTKKVPVVIMRARDAAEEGGRTQQKNTSDSHTCEILRLVRLDSLPARIAQRTGSAHASR